MAPPQLAILHTSPATLALFPSMIRACQPDAAIVNILDDSILPELNRNGGDLSAVRPRLTAYARIARDGGAALILNACSSIGELCGPVAADLGVPILRVDAAMAEAAAASGGPIAVVATLGTTRGPTLRLLREMAGAGRSIESILVDGAYAALMAGDQAGHDRAVAAAIESAGGDAASIVLAQASMARALPAVDPAIASRCLTSASFAVRTVLEAFGAR